MYERDDWKANITKNKHRTPRLYTRKHATKPEITQKEDVPVPVAIASTPIENKPSIIIDGNEQPVIIPIAIIRRRK